MLSRRQNRLADTTNTSSLRSLNQSNEVLRRGLSGSVTGSDGEFNFFSGEYDFGAPEIEESLDINKVDNVMQKLTALEIAPSPTARLARARRLAARRKASPTASNSGVQQSTINAKINRYKGSTKNQTRNSPAK